MNKGVNDTLLSNFELMSIQTEVLFSHNQFGKITSINEPESTVAPRFFLVIQKMVRLDDIALIYPTF